MNALQIKTSQIECLAASADKILDLQGFKRSKKGVKYTRKLPAAIQSFNVHLHVNPKYAQGAIAHLCPRVMLSIPQVCQVASELVAGDPALLANAPEVMVNRPLEHLVPKEESTQWYVFEESDFPKVVQDITETFLKWGLPFFNDYRNPEDIIRGYEADDQRPILQENWFVFVASAYLTLGNFDQAAKVTQSHLRSIGSRKRYAVLIENLNLMIQKTSDRL